MFLSISFRASRGQEVLPLPRRIINLDHLNPLPKPCTLIRTGAYSIFHHHLVLILSSHHRHNLNKYNLKIARLLIQLITRLLSPHPHFTHIPQAHITHVLLKQEEMSPQNLCSQDCTYIMAMDKCQEALFYISLLK